jgi:hypothetical protein
LQNSAKEAVFTLNVIELEYALSIADVIFFSRLIAFLYSLLAEMPGVARDSIRNEEIRDMQRFLPPEKGPPVLTG